MLGGEGTRHGKRQPAQRHVAAHARQRQFHPTVAVRREQSSSGSSPEGAWCFGVTGIVLSCRRTPSISDNFAFGDAHEVRQRRAEVTRRHGDFRRWCNRVPARPHTTRSRSLAFSASFQT